MIIGRGNIASAIVDRKDVIFFASGVSDSRCVDRDEFMREVNLLAQYAPDHTYDHSMLVYFSSIAVNFDSSPYIVHKIRMESLVKRWFPNYYIMRIGNIAWDTNPNTFLNYINGRRAKGLSVDIKDEYRYVIDKGTFQMACASIPVIGKHEITITSHIKKVKDYL